MPVEYIFKYMQKKKLLYIITQGHWGGAQKYIYDLADALKDKFVITVAVGEPGETSDLQKRLESYLVEEERLQDHRNVCPEMLIKA